MFTYESSFLQAKTCRRSNACRSSVSCVLRQMINYVQSTGFEQVKRQLVDPLAQLRLELVDKVIELALCGVRLTAQDCVLCLFQLRIQALADIRVVDPTKRAHAFFLKN